MTDTPTWVVEGTDVYQRYMDSKIGRMRTILNGLTFNIADGEFCSVVGPSGCGKSTLLRLILGAEQPKDGRLKIFGKPSGEPNRDRGIVYQRYSLFPNMTVLDNVIFGLELEEVNFLMKWIWYPGFRKQHQKFQKIGLEYLEKVGLSEHAYKYPYQLSGGQQQRVAIAQALIMRPRILLMDEPFGALDPGTRDTLQDWLLEIHALEKCCIFFVTHDLDEAIYLASRVFVLSQYYEKSEDEEGSAIVADIAPPKVPKEDLKTDARLLEMKEEILELGFHTDKHQPRSSFKLTHPHAIT